MVFVFHYAFSGQAVYGDGIDYWAYLPSVYFDRDVDFENEYKHIYSPENNNSFNPQKAPAVQKTSISSLGKTVNPHPPGAAVVWFPAFVFADIISFLFNLPRNGFADAYQILSGLWTVVIVIFGLAINQRLAYKFTKNKKISILAALSIFIATPLLFYGAYDVLNSHFASFTLVSLFWYLLIFKKFDVKNALLIGAVIGLATLVRIQEVLLFIPLILYLLWGNRIYLRNISASIFVFIILITPLLLVWQSIYGRPIPEVYFLTPENRFKFGSLIHPLTGLFSRTPLLLISLFGVKKFIRKDKKIFWLLFIYFILQYLVITYHGGWDAAAYGGRMYISTLPLFTILFAFTLKIIKDKWNYRIAIVVVFLFAMINIVSIMSFVLFEKEVNSGKKRGLEEQTQEKLDLILKQRVNLDSK